MSETAHNTRSDDATAIIPAVDVVEDAFGITLFADLPGVPKDKLIVRVDYDALVIGGEISLPVTEAIEATHIEVPQPRYQRTFTLGKELDSERAVAEFRQGVLKLSIPKIEHAKPRKIAIQVA